MAPANTPDGANGGRPVPEPWGVRPAHARRNGLACLVEDKATPDAAAAPVAAANPPAWSN